MTHISKKSAFKRSALLLGASSLSLAAMIAVTVAPGGARAATIKTTFTKGTLVTNAGSHGLNINFSIISSSLSSSAITDGNVSSSVTGLTSSLSSTNSAVSSVSTSVTGLATSLSSTNSTVSSVSSSVTGLATSLSSTNSTVSSVSTSVTGLATSLSSTNSTVSSVSTSVAAISSSLSTTITSVGNNTTSLSQISSSLSQTNATVTAVSGQASTAVVTANSAATVANTALSTANSTAALYSALSTSVDQRFAQVHNEIRRAYAGVAMAFAANAAPLSLGTGEQGISFGLGTFDGETSGALRYEARPTDKIFVGATVGFGDGQTGGAIGIGFKF